MSVIGKGGCGAVGIDFFSEMPLDVKSIAHTFAATIDRHMQIPFCIVTVAFAAAVSVGDCVQVTLTIVTIADGIAALVSDLGKLAKLRLVGKGNGVTQSILH